MDIKNLILFFYDDHYENLVKDALVFPEHLNKEDIKEVLVKYANVFDLSLSEEEWFAQMKQVAVECGFAANAKEYKKNKEAFKGHVGDVAAILRIVVTLRMQSPNLYFVMQIIGKERVSKRLLSAVNSL